MSTETAFKENVSSKDVIAYFNHLRTYKDKVPVLYPTAYEFAQILRHFGCTAIDISTSGFPIRSPSPLDQAAYAPEDMRVHFGSIIVRNVPEVDGKRNLLYWLADYYKYGFSGCASAPAYAQMSISFIDNRIGNQTAYDSDRLSLWSAAVVAYFAAAGMAKGKSTYSGKDPEGAV